ncbi:MAG TPA: hypothetical protein VKX16_10290 [Chloroflexota bacterium]|nr:hypothetical protein [Chloroflexota bacterium]
MTAILSYGPAFSLRVWAEKLGDEEIEVRAKVRHLPDVETRYVREWEGLPTFLRSKLDVGDLSGAVSWGHP